MTYDPIPTLSTNCENGLRNGGHAAGGGYCASTSFQLCDACLQRIYGGIAATGVVAAGRRSHVDRCRCIAWIASGMDRSSIEALIGCLKHIAMTFFAGHVRFFRLVFHPLVVSLLWTALYW